jgi:hypothetical protein
MIDMAAVKANDYLYWPNRETITWGRRESGTPTTFTTYTLTNCKRRAPTYKELSASQGVYVGTDLVWLVPFAILPSGFRINSPPITPTVGDRITDSNSQNWTILEAMRGKFGQTTRCVTRNLALHYSLVQLATHSRRSTAVNSVGISTPTWTTITSNVPCRVQEIESSVEQIHDGRAMPKRFNIMVETRLAVTAGDRLVVGGTTYAVTGHRDPDRIDTLQVITAEIVP